MTAGNCTRINKNAITIFNNVPVEPQSHTMSRVDSYSGNLHDVHIQNQLKAETSDINRLDDIDYLKALSKRYNQPLNVIVDLLLKVHEFDTQKMITLSRAKKKLNILKKDSP